jgi:hypothetical protein
MFSSPAKRVKLMPGGASADEFDDTDVLGGKMAATNQSPAQVTYKLISPPGSGGVNAATNSGVHTVLTTPMSGQFYVIGNPSDVVSGGGRVIAPKTTLTIGNRACKHCIHFPSNE